MRPVAPPCDFVVEATIEDEREEGAWITGTVKFKGQIVAEASIMLVTMDSLEEKQKIVFNDDFLKLFDVYNVAKASEGVTC